MELLAGLSQGFRRLQELLYVLGKETLRAGAKRSYALGPVHLSGTSEVGQKP